MSQHRSLKFDSVGTRHRNVLKRLERLRKLQKENRWKAEASMFGMPKVKSQKVKVKSGEGKKAAAAAEGAAAATTAAPAAAAAKTGMPAAKK